MLRRQLLIALLLIASLLALAEMHEFASTRSLSSKLAEDSSSQTTERAEQSLPAANAKVVAAREQAEATAIDPFAHARKIKKRRDALLKEANESAHLIDFVLEYKNEGLNGDDEAAYRIEQILVNCQRAGEDVTNPRTDKELTEASISRKDFDQFLESRKRELERCTSLLPPSSEVGGADTWYQLLIEHGHPESLYQRALYDDTLPVNERLDDFHRAIDSKDAEVLRDLLLHGYNGSLDRERGIVDKQAFNNAIWLAECSLGTDCSDTSWYYTGICSKVNCANVTTIRQALALRLTPVEYDSATNYADAFLSDVAKGGYDWPEAQMEEQKIRDSAANADATTGPGN